MRGLIGAKPEIITELRSIQQPKENVFGFVDDSLNHFSLTVKRNETLSDILESYHLLNTDVSEIAKRSKSIFDVRKIRTGKKYHLYTDYDSLNTIKYLVYEKNKVSFIVYDLCDSINIYSGKKEVKIVKKTKSAVIKSSLYKALIENNASIELVIKLSKIFAWQIDFYHLQKGDNFKVIYEEEYVDSQMFGIGKILSAYFKHYDKEYFAIPFVQDSVFQYFDENGNSLRKEFLKTPIEFARISSRYSSRRLHPILKVYRPHTGVDYAAPTGTPIRTVGDGEVIAASYSKSNGNYLKIRHNSVYTTAYLHMSRFGKGIKKGSSVKQGQVIGYVGSTGLATGPHLHFMFYMNGNYVNPLKIEIPPSHPVKEELRKYFERQKKMVIDDLQKIDLIDTNKDNPPA
ncbi:MAG: peptidoglycan DD-metalloendopeptidase family protein [Bacteroidetes bacterium]|nr:peptidoglycan DD-metalloendopeptidase family protein [Bacteroidota bacterium]